MKRTRPRGTTRRWLIDAASSQTDECLLWPFATSNGYGITHYGGKRRYVHHVALLLVGRDAPTPGQQTRHLCGAHLCCNPRHLLNGTPTENRADQSVHGTEYRGERHHRARLNEASVRAIRAAYRRDGRRTNVSDLAREYGVSRQQVLRVATGLAWAHVDEEGVSL